MGDSWLFDLQLGQNVVFPQALSDLPSSRMMVLNANQTTHPIGRRGTFANKQHLLPWNRHFLIHKVFDLCHGVLPNVLEVVLGWKAMECWKAWDVEAMIYIYYDHFKDSERGLCPMKQLPAAICQVFISLVTNIHHFMKCWGPLQTEKPIANVIFSLLARIQVTWGCKRIFHFARAVMIFNSSGITRTRFKEESSGCSGASPRKMSQN